MTRLAFAAGTLLLIFGADNPQVMPWRTPSPKPPDILSGATIPLFPDTNSSSQASQKQSAGQDAKDVKKTDGPLQSSAELALVRYVDGEFAHAVKSLPGGRTGLTLHAGQPLSEEQLKRALMNHGAAVNPGDQVQITAIRFKKTQIVLQINGGGKGRFNWRDHIQVGIGGMPTTTATSNVADQPEIGLGATIVLDFGKPIPNMTPEELKKLLSPVLNFATDQRSAAVLWTETLPPEMKQAISDKRAVVGMSHEMVEAAIGKPDKKIRERDTEGADTEDWIYGQPPAKTIFVTFLGDRVIRIKQYPSDPIAQR
jgi:hypothetical protein